MKGRFGYQWQAALALVSPIYDTSVESTIFAGIQFMKILACDRLGISFIDWFIMENGTGKF